MKNPLLLSGAAVLLVAAGFMAGRSSAWNGAADGMMNVARLLKSPDEQSAYLAQVFENMTGDSSRKMNAKDFQILAYQLKAMGLTGEPAAKAQAALDATAVKTLGK